MRPGELAAPSSRLGLPLFVKSLQHPARGVPTLEVPKHTRSTGESTTTLVELRRASDAIAIQILLNGIETRIDTFQ